MFAAQSRAILEGLSFQATVPTTCTLELRDVNGDPVDDSRANVSVSISNDTLTTPSNAANVSSASLQPSEAMVYLDSIEAPQYHSTEVVEMGGKVNFCNITMLVSPEIQFEELRFKMHNKANRVQAVKVDSPSNAIPCRVWPLRPGYFGFDVLAAEPGAYTVAISVCTLCNKFSWAARSNA